MVSRDTGNQVSRCVPMNYEHSDYEVMVLRVILLGTSFNFAPHEQLFAAQRHLAVFFSGSLLENSPALYPLKRTKRLKLPV